MKNNTRIDILKNSIFATLGLMLFAFGSYLIIQANIGVEPWIAFAIGLSNQLGILYGTASILISFSVIVIDLLLKEKIGLGTILDAIVVGKTVDLLNWLDLVPQSHNLWISLAMMIVAFFIMGIAQYVYMKAELSCGPRDALLVALSKRAPKMPIGFINIILLAVVLVIGWKLGGPIGIGTIISPFGIGLMQQLAFNLVKFEPKNVTHQSLIGSIKVIFKNSKRIV